LNCMLRKPGYRHRARRPWRTVMDDVLGYAGRHAVVTGFGALQTGQVDLSTLFATQR
jgi:hypothetical protein